EDRGQQTPVRHGGGSCRGLSAPAVVRVAAAGDSLYARVREREAAAVIVLERLRHGREREALVAAAQRDGDLVVAVLGLAADARRGQGRVLVVVAVVAFLARSGIH